MNFLTGMTMTFNLKDIQCSKFLIQEAKPYTSSLPIQFSNHWAITKCISCRLLVSNLIKGERTLESFTSVNHHFSFLCPLSSCHIWYSTLLLKGEQKKKSLVFSFFSLFKQLYTSPWFIWLYSQVSNTRRNWNCSRSWKKW